MIIRRGAAALALVAAMVCAASGARAAVPAGAALAPGASVLPDGLSLLVRRATLSPSAALELWIACPSDGYTASKPGLARLTALSIVAARVNGVSLRDAVRAAGGQLTVSVFPSSTEITVLAPASVQDQLMTTLLERTLHPAVDQGGLVEAKARIAEQQAIATATADVVLRDALFKQLFTGGPFRASTYGGPEDLRAFTLADAQAFAAQAYVPQHEMVVAVGGGIDEATLAKLIADAAPASAAAAPMPASPRAAAGGGSVNAGFADVGGVALGWIGPPISDESAATAMDFLSDYLTRPDSGVIAKAVHDADPDADFNGQFITLRDDGVFYVTVTGEALKAADMDLAMRKALQHVLAGPLPAKEFALALEAFRTHTLRDAQTPMQLADNYGWYFAQGAPAYAPSVTDMALNGDYFQRVAALTPDAVFAAAKTYLGANPVSATVAPHPSTPATTSMTAGPSAARRGR
jgi:predicted Zn-dependent peptidase